MTAEKLLTITQAAERLGVHYQTLRDWADNGRVPVVKLPSGYRRFEPAVIEEMRREMGYRDDEPAAKRPAGRPRKEAEDSSTKSLDSRIES